MIPGRRWTRIANYKKMYFDLAARVADAIELLIEAQQNAENQYMEEDDMPAITLAPQPPETPDQTPAPEAHPTTDNDDNGGSAETS
ncbi:hypothetical protein LJC04_03145 [Ruminococcaceae bacterium OttesenSCG-928-O06]|nr:hypothetical protein [Ruminococcaceae bacterium OttesenSCG-928-O06]